MSLCMMKILTESAHNTALYQLDSENETLLDQEDNDSLTEEAPSPSHCKDSFSVAVVTSCMTYIVFLPCMLNFMLMHVGAKLKGDIKRRLQLIKKKLIMFAVILFIVMVLFSVPYIVTSTLKHQRNSHCHDIPVPTRRLIAKNSTIVLLNTTNVLDQLLSCQESMLEVVANFPMSIYLIVCKTLKHTRYYLKDHTSIKYFNASNPLPAAFDERYPNYLLNGNINVTVDVSVSANKKFSV